MLLSSDQWVDLAGRIGPYGGIQTVQDAEQLNADGFTLVLPSSYDPKLLAALAHHGIKYIDNYMWQLIYQACRQQNDFRRAQHQVAACELSTEEQEAIASQTRNHLEAISSDHSVAGFWILDDYPGQISPTLKTIHSLVAHANAAAGLHRPTICGAGGILDMKNMSRRISRRYLNLALSNITPEGCDLVSPYLYAASSDNNPDLVDWSMHKTIPYLIRTLKDRQFNVSSPLLLPLLHAFSTSNHYVMPRPQDIVAQTKAYAKVKPVALLFFTWQSADAEQSYSNNAVIREGVRQAAAYFRAQESR